jgi:hypothetical protein
MKHSNLFFAVGILCFLGVNSLWARPAMESDIRPRAPAELSTPENLTLPAPINEPEKTDTQEQTRVRRSRSVPEMITVNGTLQLKNGLIAVEDEEKFYYVPLLMLYVRFIEGLKEGNDVTIVGYARGNYFWPMKMNIDNNSYDFSPSTLRSDWRNGNFGLMHGKQRPRRW